MQFFERLARRDALLESRWLRPFAHLFSHPSLWHLNRRSVPRGIAVGLFAAFALPIGQFALAALLALPLRANVPLAAVATLVSNPLTFPAIYVAAFKVGSLVLRHSPDDAGEIAGSFGAFLLEVSAPTAVGLLLFAISSAAAGFVAAKWWWRLRVLRRHRSRCRRAPA